MKTYRVPPFLTTDPANKRNQIGKEILNDNGVITLKFGDGSTGRYMDYCLIGIHKGIDLTENQMDKVNEIRELLEGCVSETEIPKRMVSDYDGGNEVNDFLIAYAFFFEKELSTSREANFA